jgi:hypothetical protein
MRGFQCIFERGKANFVAIMGQFIVKNSTQPQPKILESIKFNLALDSFIANFWK